MLKYITVVFVIWKYASSPIIAVIFWGISNCSFSVSGSNLANFRCFVQDCYTVKRMKGNAFEN
jgi:hypothetical protein